MKVNDDMPFDDTHFFHGRGHTHAGEQEAALLAHGWRLICDADALLIAAGAGLGVESGLPDFRGPRGFWRHYPALAAVGLNLREVATPAALLRQPEEVWGFYGHRLRQYRDTRPNPSFAHMRRWGTAKAHGWAVFTSNIDGQFQKAGFHQDDGPIQECHGSLHFLQCVRPCSDLIWPANDFEPQVDEARCRLLGPLPRCPRCGSLARPNVTMFDDLQWLDHRTQAQADALRAWRQALPRAGVVLEIGAGTAIPTVRAFSEARVHEGWSLVRVNPEVRPLRTPRTVHLPMRASAFFEAMTAIEAAGSTHERTAPWTR